MIELRHLRYFVAVAEELNFRRASERVHIDQTPLSRTIRDLEEQLGLQLLIREPRKLHLTPAGLRLLNEVHEIFSRIERAYRVVRETDARFRTPLRIGIADGIAQPKLSECLIQWREIAPEIPLELTELRAAELANALEREEIDIGFTFGLPNNDSIAQQPAWSYPVVALLPAGHELASQTVLTISELLAFPLQSCHGDRLPGLLNQIRNIAQSHTTKPTFAGEARTLSGYFTRIAAGLGVGVADAGHVATLRRFDIVSIPLHENERITTFVVHKRQRFSLPTGLQRFVAHAKTLN